MVDDDEEPADTDVPPPPKAEVRERPDREREVRHDRPGPVTGEGDKLTETIRQRLEQLVPDLVKKTFAAGMGAVFTTEEGIRRVVGGARDNLPEVAGYVASTADAAKDRVFEVIARETREFLSSLNLPEEIAKVLTMLSFEIKTEIRFIPNSERMVGAEPDVKASVRLKRTDRPDAKAEPKDDDATPRDSRSRLRFWRRDGGEGGSDPEPDDTHEK